MTTVRRSVNDSGKPPHLPPPSLLLQHAVFNIRVSGILRPATIQVVLGFDSIQKSFSKSATVLVFTFKTQLAHLAIPAIVFYHEYVITSSLVGGCVCDSFNPIRELLHEEDFETLRGA